MTEQYLVLDMDAAIDRMGDREIYLEIAHCFADNLPAALDALDAAICDLDMPTATRLAHSLKGNCSTVGAEELRAACLSMEQLCRAASTTPETATEGDPNPAQGPAEARRQFDALCPRLLALRETLATL